MKTGILLFLIIILAVFLVSCEKKVDTKNLDNNSAQILQPTENISIKNQTNKSAPPPVIEQKQEQNMFSMEEAERRCKMTKGDMYQAWCYKEIASKIQSVSYCDKINLAIEKDACYRDVSQLTKNITLCKQIKYALYRDQCISKIASDLKDPSLCEGVYVSRMREECLTTSK